jgi:hypothetical protein
MTPENKLTALDILRRILFKSRSEKEAQRMLIDSIKKDLIPREQLPLELTEVYIDKPHVKTTHQSWPDVMDRIEKVRQNEFLYAIHVTRGGEIEYTWQQEKK